MRLFGIDLARLPKEKTGPNWREAVCKEIIAKKFPKPAKYYALQLLEG